MNKPSICTLLVTIAIIGMMANSTGTSAQWLDTEKTKCSMTAWIPLLWKQTTQNDFAHDTLYNADIWGSPGNVTLAFTYQQFAFGGGNTRNFWSFNPLTGLWTTTLAQPSANVYQGGSLVYDGGSYLYALQGNGQRTFWRYEISANAWTALAQTPAAVSNGGKLVYVDSNSLYAFRGGNTATFWCYNIAANTWSTMANAPATLNDDTSLCASKAGYIYALQGNNQSTFWQYSIAGNSWTSMAQAPQRAGPGNALTYDPIDNQIYALRGNNHSDFWCYDIGTNSWSSLAQTPGRIQSGGSLSYTALGQVYALQGNGARGFWHYSISLDSWTADTQTPVAVSDGGSLTIGPVTYTSSGQIDSSILNTAQVGCKIRGVFWNASYGPTTHVQVLIRASDNSNLGTVPWTNLGETSPALLGLPSGQYVQWRVILTTTNVKSTPVLQEVRVYYG